MIYLHKMHNVLRYLLSQGVTLVFTLVAFIAVFITVYYRYIKAP